MQGNPSNTEQRLPLSGVNVLDLSRVLAGPWATMSLADLGATVWKIENIDGGDDTRAWSIPSYKGVSTYFLCANRGKHSVALDLKSKEGLEIVRALAAKCDIVVENFRVGTAERLGVGYDQLRKINPELIYCSISGYGRDSSEARRPGYDFVVQAESGLMAITGEKEGQPLRFGIAITDVVCGMVATQSILAALIQRDRTGRGQQIDLSLLDCGLNLLINVGSAYLNTGAEVKRYGNAHPTVVPYQIFNCSDGDLALAVGNDRQFRALCRSVIGQPELADDPRFTTANGRAANREALIPILAKVFETMTRQHWMGVCATAEVPAGVVKTVPEALGSRNVLERGTIQTLHSDAVGPVSLVRPAQGLRAQRHSLPLPPPMLGQDTQSVLRDVLGYSDEAIGSLIEAGVVSQYDSATQSVPTT
ncbi:CoA transferase [Mesorhizobium sp. B3-1-3]|uniref:CaiB/BaiF CoA transferase family protein n=1 Tax=unclassified Mesorhizobium TaxID=325217 RepID=UPI00112B40DD|nr:MULTISPECIES: CaiB/BaiF CoA-transferase family protein [unclassified Mesorhizobium]TPI57356.1 CoA transferase [Mesorhizobium sp. B3-1-8]TPI63509.1 CoA transferase [Mesorhizobium sp. B3-1-3]